MFTRYRLTWRVRPVPWQVGQGSLISVPVPPHWRHGWEIEKRPCDSASTPRPWQRLQTVGVVPGFAPVPWQVVQGADNGTLTGIWAPSIAWSKLTWTSVSRSRPRSGRERTPPARPPPPPAAPVKRSERMSPKPPKPPRKLFGSKPPAPPPKMPPPVSYALRFSGSDRIELASWISLKRSSAEASPGLVSGWYWRASLR